MADVAPDERPDVWNAQTVQQFWVTFNLSGTMLAAGSTDGTAWFWDMANAANPALIAHVADTLNPGGIVYTLAFSPDGSTLAVGSNESVRLWRAGH